ncbi:MAG: phosphate/phosphite/phosphonate ABC transporter substrate-binding protein, partial [Chloroflexi bacterium]|nr:phosphate/phosphite/phosphonate ABC transporter substrate-binding protein [Chloroflexota bacterium]
GTITIWNGYHTGDNEEKTLNQLLDAAKKAFPDAKINVLEIPFDQLFNKFETEAATGGGPDMYIAPNDSLGKEARAGLLAPLDDLLKGKLDPYSKLSVQGVTVDGKIYAVPMIPKALAMYYNKSTVANPPKTTDELLALVKSGKKVGIPNSGYHTFGWWRAFGGSLMDDKGKCVADTTGVADAYKFLMDLKAAGANITDDGKLDTLYRQGQLDVYFNGPWVLGGNEDGLGKDKVGVAAMPKGPKGDAGPLTGIDGWYINANSKNKESAVNLALFFATKDAQTLYANIAGDPPARTDVAPTNANVKAFADAANAGVPRPLVPQLDNFWGPFGDAATKIFEGKSQPAFWGPFGDAATKIFEGKSQPADAIKEACAAMNKANKIDTGAVASSSSAAPAPTTAASSSSAAAGPTPTTAPAKCEKLPNMPTAKAGELGSPDKPIVITFVPSGDVPTITKAGNETAECLGKITGLSYKIEVGTSYAVSIEAMGAGKAHAGFLATFAAILAREKYGIEPAMASTRAYTSGGDSDPDKGFAGQQTDFYKGQFITKKDSGIKTLNDLKGKTFCSAGATSTSGWIIPSINLKANGINPDKDLKAVTHATGHPAVVIAVYKGDCDAGATFVDARTDATVLRTYPDVNDKVVPFFLSIRIPNDGLQFIKGFDPVLAKATTDGLLAMMADPGGKAVVRRAYSYDALKIVPATFYDEFKELLKKAGVDAATLVK